MFYERGQKEFMFLARIVYVNTDCADDADMHISVKIRPLIKRRACKACPIPCKLRFSVYPCHTCSIKTDC
jgi:hypothetical protein